VSRREEVLALGAAQWSSLAVAMSWRAAYRHTAMTYTSVNGLQLYYETHGSGRPLVLLHGGLLTIDLNFGPLLEPLAASRQVIAVELQGHGHTADTDRPMTIEALAGDVVALLDYLGVAEADFFGFSLGGLVACAVALSAPARVGKLIVASADPHRPPGRVSAPLDEDRMPTTADFQAWRDAYDAVAPDPTHPRRQLSEGAEHSRLYGIATMAAENTSDRRTQAGRSPQAEPRPPPSCGRSPTSAGDLARPV
jgi:pimeloyl-ACP methyl ester carboxylesterase